MMTPRRRPAPRDLSKAMTLSLDYLMLVTSWFASLAMATRPKSPPPRRGHRRRSDHDELTDSLSYSALVAVRRELNGRLPARKALGCVEGTRSNPPPGLDQTRPDCGSMKRS